VTLKIEICGKPNRRLCGNPTVRMCDDFALRRRDNLRLRIYDNPTAVILWCERETIASYDRVAIPEQEQSNIFMIEIFGNPQ
jgi:hypothetical protein